ncbi:zinc-ribbon domain-containing protein [Lancefieldella parvula]|uniref:zinc-ribbon domain-containing protein n=1 Tax=Lancefieldella parvula TaxID=1382 RepID=UPI0037C15072
MTNREEVAKRWRKVGERLDKEPPISLTGTACITLWELLESAGIRDNNSYSDVFSRLADLIDTTCKQVEASNNIVCSECGADLYDDDLYCVRCGARVVRRNDKA